MDHSLWKTIIDSLIAPFVGLAVWYVKKVLERRWAKKDRELPATTVAPDPGQPAPPQPVAGGPEVRLVSHSQFFYWWPVWMLGFLFAALTTWSGHRLAVVPAGTALEATADGTFQMTVPAGGESDPSLAEAVARTKRGDEAFPTRVSQARKFYGPMFLQVLVMVIVLTNFSFRGAWSFVLIGTFIALAIGLALLGWWDAVLSTLGALNVQMNASAYLFLAVSLFALWAFTVFVIDQQRYLIISAGEVRMRTAFRPQEVRFATAGVVFDKASDDPLLHQVLGFGSGDLIVRTPNGSEFYFPNVLFLPQKLAQLKSLLAPGQVV